MAEKQLEKWYNFKETIMVLLGDLISLYEDQSGIIFNLSPSSSLTQYPPLRWHIIVQEDIELKPETFQIHVFAIIFFVHVDPLRLSNLFDF